jgi:outer membrane protein OmpA-like peptidoglycan-associated protein
MQRFRFGFSLIIIIAVFLPSVLQAADVEENYPVGTLVMPELLVGVSTRATAMGGMGVATSGDLSGVLCNPAAIHDLKHLQFEVTHNSWIEDSFQENLLMGVPLSSNVVLAVGGTYFSLGKISKTGINTDGSMIFENQTLDLGAFGGYASLAAGLSDSFSLGGTVKYFQESLGPVALATEAVDLGLQYMGNEELCWGLSLNNMSLGVEGYSLPATARLGVAYNAAISPSQHLLLGTEFEMLLGSLGQSIYHLGMEYNFWDVVQLRLGYQYMDTTSVGMSGLTAGLGLHFGVFKLGYTFSPLGDLGTSHRISIAFEFLPSGPEKKKVRRRAKQPDLPMSPNAIAFGTVQTQSGGGSGYSGPKTASVSKEEEAMRSLLKKQLDVQASIQGDKKNQEVVFKITRGVGTRIAKWSLVISDRLKNPLRNYKGDDLPDKVIWNGRTEEGDLVKEIETSRFKLTLTDVNGKEESATGGLTLNAVQPVLEEEAVDAKDEAQSRVFDPILFEVQRAEISKEAGRIIGEVAIFVRKHPKAKIYIESYTDSVDEGDKALVLSKSRSEAVARYLTAYHSISLTRILMRSRGAKNPAVSNDDPRQRFKNRRVVITVR